MIKIQDSVPSIYYDSSRDFQLIGHLFDLVLNATKTDADLVFNLPFSTNSDDQLLELMAFTFGLRLNKAKYTSRQLRNVCSVAPKMMRAKGSLKAVQILCTALMRADGIEGIYSISISADGAELTISLSSIATCKDILIELLPYILPAGMIFNITQSGSTSAAVQERFSLADRVRIEEAAPTMQIYSPGAVQQMQSQLIFQNTGLNDRPLNPKVGIIDNLTVTDPRRLSALAEETKFIAPEDTGGQR